MHWAKDLELDSYFELVDENDFRNRGGANIDDLISSLEKDPFGLETDTDARKKKMQEFKTSKDDIGTNMAVVMFMVEALRYFKDKSQKEIKDIAFEIAMYGTQGYDPKKKDYKITDIPEKDFSGYHILAYYYVSWALAIPESLKDLQMPYDKEYEVARRIFGEG